MSEGEMLVDEYKLVNCVATGTNTQVWEVSEKTTSSPFAMKLLLPEAFADREQKAILKHEATVGKQLVHPNLVTVHKVVMNKQHGYIVMDYFRGQNVKQQIGNDLLGVHVRIRKLIEGLLQALSFMHSKGWLHRDIKPDNILLNKSSECRLIDYSLTSRASGAVGRMLGGKLKVIQGTRTYIAPETIRRERPQVATDIYSLGITLFEMLTGEPPYKGTSPNDLLKKHIAAKIPKPSEFNPNVTPEMDEWIVKMLAKKPSARPASVDALSAEFRNVKIFKEDVQELHDRRSKEAKAKQLESLDEAQRLDSRADALRVEAIKRGEKPAPAPQRAVKKAVAKRPVDPEPVAPAASAVPPQPVMQPPGYGYPAYPPAPMMPPPPPPMMPGYWPQPPVPGYGFPQPGPFVPPGAMPQMPMPPAPPYGAPAPPIAPVPPAAAQPAQRPAPPPPPPAQAPPAAARPAPAAPRQPAPPPPQPAKPVADDLPFMDELPNID